MSTTIRPEVSEKNKYWIDKHRYYELKHFCLQYPMWKKNYDMLDGIRGQSYNFIPTKSSTYGNAIEKCVMDRDFYYTKMAMLKSVADETDVTLSDYILKAITEGISYDCMKARFNIPCCRDTYYELYRRFFWLLNKARN